MEILPKHYYTAIMRVGEYQREGHCFDLIVQELSAEESSQYKVTDEKGDSEPTHIVVFRDTEQPRVYVGWVKEDSKERLVFDLGGGKEYEFRPLNRPSDINS